MFYVVCQQHPEWTFAVFFDVEILGIEVVFRFFQDVVPCSTRCGVGAVLGAEEVFNGDSVGELSNLTWQDIDLDARALHVRGLIARYYKIEEDVKVWPTDRDAGSSSRDIPLSEAHIAFLKGEEGNHLPELFIMSNDSRPTDARVIRRAVSSICSALGIKGVQYKDLRHSFAVRFLEAGGDYTTLAAVLGVGNISRLAALYEKHLKRDVRKEINAMMDSIHFSLN